MKLSELMSIVTTRHKADESLLSVIQKIAEKHYSCALVCEYDKPIGIITERDVVRLFATNGLKEGMTAGDAMSRDPICVDGDTTILEALDLCESRNLRHLLVMDKTHRLVGVVTQTDMVKAHVKNYEHHDKLQDQNHRLHLLSIEDPLTGLPNRRAMEIDIKHAAAVSKRQSQPYSIALIDIDYFKKYNDSYGHRAGDEALIFLAEKLRKNLRNSDKIFRYGGEEFLFLMPMTSAQGAKIATQQICDTVAQEKYPHKPSDLGFLTVSIGYAASYSENWEMVVEQADLALYDAKIGGRNQICSAEEPGESEFWDLSRKVDEGQPFIN